MSTLLSADVPDPTDFPPESTLPGLRSLDASLQCDICGELYNAPVSLPCGHGFCSLCVRESLKQEQCCPSCRSSARDVHLKRNVPLEEAVTAWKKARSTILRLIRENNEAKTVQLSESPKKRRRMNGNGRGSSPPSRSTGVGRGTMDEDRIEEVLSDPVRPTSDSPVSCPICHKEVPEPKINQHIDSGCKQHLGSSSRSDKSKQDWSNIFKPAKGKEKDKREVDRIQEEPERLATAPYDALKDKRLREMLSDLKLPTTGDKELLRARHKQYVMIFNANLDADPKRRQDESSLRADLKRWEESRNVKKPVVEDVIAYQKIHKAEFSALVAAAKKTRPKEAASREQAQGSQALS